MKKKEFEKRVDEVTTKLADTLKRKNADYGSSFERLFQLIGMNYAYGHMAEKLERVWSLMHTEANVNESMYDSLYDLAGYAILTIIHSQKETNNSKVKQDGDFNVGDYIARVEDKGERTHVYVIDVVCRDFITVRCGDRRIVIPRSDFHLWEKISKI